MFEFDFLECRTFGRTEQRSRHLRHRLETNYGWKKSPPLKLVIVQIRIGAARQVEVDHKLDLRIVDFELFEETQERKFRTLNFKRRQIAVASHYNDGHRPDRLAQQTLQNGDALFRRDGSDPCSY